MQANYANALCHLNATPLNKAKMGQCLAGGLLSLSLSLSRCSHFWHTFGLNLKGFFTHFIVVLTHLFAYKKAFFRALCFFEIFKRFVFGLFALVIASRFCENGGFCHFEPFAKRRKIQRLESALAILGYFANAQYDKFGLLLKNNGYFHSNFKAKIQIFHSKFKAFYKFNSFYKFISNFKPYTRLFHIFTPSFRSVQTDKKFFTRRTLCLNRNL